MPECDRPDCHRDALEELFAGQWCAICIDAHHDPGAALNLQEVSR